MAYLRFFPVTSFFLGLNALLFGLVQAQMLPLGFFAFIPGVLNPGLFLCHFMHTGWLHFLFNSVVLIQIGPMIEGRLGSGKFLGVLFGIWGILTFLMFEIVPYPAVGFSGILMGMMAFGALSYSRLTYERQVFEGLLLANLLLGLHPQIAFWVHFLGALAGAMVFYIKNPLKF